MFAQSSELRMRLVRFILLAGWLSILLLCIVDVGQSRFTDAADSLALEGLVGKTIELRGEILEPVPYNPATRIFWGVAIPLVVLLLIFVGHDTWRRICPLSAISQIPRWFGWQIKWRKGNSRSVAMVNPNGLWARNAIVIQLFLLAAAVTMRLTLLSANPEALFAFTLAVFGVAFVIGLVFGGKAWCHYLCPMNVVQLVISGPRGLNSESPNSSGLSQSMCRKPGMEGRDVSTCVGCISPCPDVDMERNYWDRLPTLSRRFAVYGYLGIVLGFIHGIYAATGNFNYGAAVWYDSDWQAIGFVPFGEFIEVPRILGSAVLMLAWISITFSIGLLIEKAIQRQLKRKCSPELSVETARHRTMIGFTIIALVSLLYGVALPGMGWLPEWLVFCVGIAATGALFIWAYRSWQRSSQRYQKENLAHSLLRQLKPLKEDWTDLLDGKNIDDLSADEIHLMAGLVPNLVADSRLVFYEAFLTDAIEQGTADGIEGRKILADLRESCDISTEEHRAIVDRLKGDYAINDTLLISSGLRINSFRQQIENILLNELCAGKSLTESISSNQRKIDSLRQDYSITQEEEDKVLDELGSKKGTLISVVEGLVQQLHEISDLQLVLGDRAAERYLFDYFQEQARSIVGQSLGLLEAVENQVHRNTLIVSLCNAHAKAVELEIIQHKDKYSASIYEPVSSAMDENNFAVDISLKQLNKEAILKRLSKIEEPLVGLVVARAAQFCGYQWANALYQESVAAIGAVSDKKKLSADFSGKRILQLNLWSGENIIVEHNIKCGRAEDNDWVIKIPEASRHHFKIYQSGGKYYIEDLNSVNGTLVANHLLQGESMLISSDIEVRVSHDTNPVLLKFVDIPVEDCEHPIDLYIALKLSHCFDMLSGQQLLKLAVNGEVLKLALRERIDPALSVQKYVGFVLDGCFTARLDNSTAIRLAEYSFVDRDIMPTIEAVGQGFHGADVLILWEQDVWDKVFYSCKDFQIKVLTDYIILYKAGIQTSISI